MDINKKLIEKILTDAEYRDKGKLEKYALSSVNGEMLPWLSA